MKGRTITHDELLDWAQLVPLEPTRDVGADRQARVLLALCRHAGPDLRAWPAAQTLASKLSGLDRRRVRECFDALSAQGVITRDGKHGRAVRWRIHPTLGGHVATEATAPEHVEHMAGDVAGLPATKAAPGVAGDVAGEVAGNLAGLPATNWNGNENMPAVDAQTTDAFDQFKALTENDRGAFMTFIGARGDALVMHLHREGKLAGRLNDWRQAKGATDRLAALEHEKATAPDCSTHGTRAYLNGWCRACVTDHRLGDHAGQHRTACRNCQEPSRAKGNGPTGPAADPYGFGVGIRCEHGTTFRDPECERCEREKAARRAQRRSQLATTAR